MKAVRLIKYSKKHPQIEIKQISLRDLKANEVLVKVKSAGVNPLDNLIAHGELKLVVPYKLPETMGNEFVGIVEAIGKNVQNFKIGDRVFARNPVDHIGAFADELIIKESAIAKVPEYLSDQEAAAVPLTALTAMQALKLLDAQSGQTIFISGGSGSFGAMAIPIAVAKGLKVITTGNPASRRRIERMGVARYIDYTTEDYTEEVENVDMVIDTLGGNELFKEMSILRPNGKILSLRAMPNKDFAKRMHMGKLKEILFGLASHKIEKVAKKHQVTYYFLFVMANGQELAEASEILAKNNIHPALGRQYPLDRTVDAMRRVEKEHNPGKVIINM